jgi:ferric-dicitrate binding protein FerR (iron transport regulator)
MQQPTFEKYAHYQAEDFLQDVYFQHWVISADVEADTFWQDFVLTYPHQQEGVEQARKLAGSIRYHPHRLSKEKQAAMLERVYATSQGSGASAFYRWRYVAVAASVSVLFVSALFWIFYPAYETYQTGYQQTKTIILSDGSEVILNASTTIKVAIDTDENQPRQVWLDGEAYFHVKHLDDEQTVLKPALKKFVVHTDNFDIEVLGTIFNASSRASKSEVLLKEGSVKIASEKLAQSQILEPGEQLALSEEDKSFRITKAEEVVEPAWRENYFIFQNTPLYKVAQEIENYYGLEVEMADPSLAEKIFTAKVSREDLPILFEAIKASFDVKVIQEGNVISIQK